MLIRFLLAALLFALIRFLVRAARTMLHHTRNDELHARPRAGSYSTRGERVVDVDYTEEKEDGSSKGKSW